MATEVEKPDEVARGPRSRTDDIVDAISDLIAVICPLVTALEEVAPGTKLKIARNLESEPEAAKRSPRKEMIEFMRYGLPPDLRVVD